MPAAPQRVQSLRSSVKLQRPTTGTRDPGEIYTNFPDLQLGVVNAAKVAQDLLAVRFFSALTDYSTGDFVVNGGFGYKARASVPAGVFDPAQWDTGLGPTDHIRSDTSDLSLRMTGAAGAASWVFNDKADGTGNDVLKLNEAATSTNLILKSVAGNSVLFMDKLTSGWVSGIQGRNNGVVRWYVYLGDGTAEGGSNAGSDFLINRYDDAGTGGAAAMKINRATKKVDFYGDVANTVTGTFIGSNSGIVLGGTTGSAGTVWLRPNGFDSATGQTTIATSGNMIVAGDLQVNGGDVTCSNYSSFATLFYLGTTGAGTIHFRPNGVGSATGQTTVDAAGTMSVAANVAAGSGYLLGSASTVYIAPNVSGSGTGSINLRPTGHSSTVGHTVLEADGTLTVAGTLKSLTHFNSVGTSAILSTTGAGTVIFRPNGMASGTGQTTIVDTGAMTVNGTIQSIAARITSGNDIFAGAGTTVILAPTTAGTVYLRPGTAGSATGQTTIASDGAMTVGGIVVANQDFRSSTTTAIVAASTTGSVYLRPGGPASTTGEVRFTTTGIGFFGVTPYVRPALAAATGTVQRSTYATGSVTLPQLAGVVMAIIADLRAYGLES